MGVAQAVQHAVFSLAARTEQEIRAYPRIYSAFYTTLTRSQHVRRLVGRAKSGVRGPAASWSHVRPADDDAVQAAREAAVAIRLGIRRREAG